MDEYTKKEKDFLLKLARKSIEHYLATGKKLEIKEDKVPFENLKQKRAVFVTLMKNGDLRGCIGCLEAKIPLYQEVIDKAIGAAFQDPRFLPLGREELDNTKISLSILTWPKTLVYKGSNDLLQKLIPLKDGVILKKGFNGATYLPEVWEQLPNKEEFLESLCQKAGLPSDAWKQNPEISTYQTIHFSE